MCIRDRYRRVDGVVVQWEAHRYAALAIGSLGRLLDVPGLSDRLRVCVTFVSRARYICVTLTSQARRGAAAAPRCG
eukprot:2932930-Pyramimonas_sp.AAC.1